MPGRIPPPDPIIGQLLSPMPPPDDRCPPLGPSVARPKKNPQKKITDTMKTVPAAIATTDQIWSTLLGRPEGSAWEGCAGATGVSLDSGVCVILRNTATLYPWGVGTKVTHSACSPLTRPPGHPGADSSSRFIATVPSYFMQIIRRYSPHRGTTGGPVPFATPEVRVVSTSVRQGTAGTAGSDRTREALRDALSCRMFGRTWAGWARHTADRRRRAAV